MGAPSLLASWAIRIYHFLLCSFIIFGTLFATSLWECIFILFLLVIVHVSHKVYAECVFTEYEKADGFPSMSELMKAIVFSHDKTISLKSFELFLANIFIFMICFRMLSMVVISPKILFA
jgi:hypothetical protein